MTIPSSRSLIFEVKSTGSELAFGRLRQTSDVFGRLRTSSGIFGNDRVVFKNPSTPRIKISHLYLRKSWQVYKWHFWQNFRWQINNVWKFYISVSCIGSYYFTCISRKSSFAPNFSNLRFFRNSWKFKPNLISLHQSNTVILPPVLSFQTW